MRGHLLFKGAKIHYRYSGKGSVIVLLHGFTENQDIWDSFMKKLRDEFRIITVDLPGHGRSGIVGEVHTMELMAEVVNRVLNRLKVRKCVMIGHSMGGYVTLAFARQYPGKLKGFGLFHSHAAADSEEVKINRERTMRIIDQDKIGFLNDFVPLLFNESRVYEFREEIDRLMKAASSIDKKGLIAALAGMRDRKPMTELLKTTDLPVLFIIGKHDSRITPELSLQQSAMPKKCLSLLLEDVGHMGFIESPRATLEVIRSFIKISNPH